MLLDKVSNNLISCYFKRWELNDMSWKAEVIADSSGKWCGNGLRFATRQEAERYVSDLSWRWTAVRDTRVVDVADAVTEKAE
jgi:hypothetical protein